MLDEKRIEQLKRLSREGKEAQEILNEYHNLMSQLKALEDILKYGISEHCFKLAFNNGYNETSININKTSDAGTLIRQILQNEIDYLKLELSKLN